VSFPHISSLRKVRGFARTIRGIARTIRGIARTIRTQEL
jgi:hypothetical protein